MGEGEDKKNGFKAIFKVLWPVGRILPVEHCLPDPSAACGSLNWPTGSMQGASDGSVSEPLSHAAQPQSSSSIAPKQYCMQPPLCSFGAVMHLKRWMAKWMPEAVQPQNRQSRTLPPAAATPGHTGFGIWSLSVDLVQPAHWPCATHPTCRVRWVWHPCFKAILKIQDRDNVPSRSAVWCGDTVGDFAVDSLIKKCHLGKQKGSFVEIQGNGRHYMSN